MKKRYPDIGFFRLLILMLACVFCTRQISAQTELLPSYPVKSANVDYLIRKYDIGDSTSHHFLRKTFDNFGEFRKEELFYGPGISIENPVTIIFKGNNIFRLNFPEACATRTKTNFNDFSFDNSDQLFQDLLHGKINRQTDINFRSFKNTGPMQFLDLNCTRFEYIYFNSLSNTTDRKEFWVYHEICLKTYYYWGDMLVSVIEAKRFNENIPLETTVFDVPAKYRIIDGEKAEIRLSDSKTGFSTAVVEYVTKRDFTGVKENGTKTLYIRDSGNASAADWHGTLVQFGLPAEKKHLSTIRDAEYEFNVNYDQKEVHRKNLTNSCYAEKSTAELNYILENQVYDNKVKYLGNENFLGKECKIFEIRIGAEKLVVSEWQGIFLKLKKYICPPRGDCANPLLALEETATRLEVDVPIDEHVFKIPDNYKLIPE